MSDSNSTKALHPLHPLTRPRHTSKTLRYIDKTCYLDDPQYVPGGNGYQCLRATNPIRSIVYFLNQHPVIAFAIVKTYVTIAPAHQSKIETKYKTSR
ncbi:uncharacterized protein RAG0_01596 [Rhynchosporium agropyri]|uniref:Uncharacterized protein n=1 Tax=Rhynchosporium agropyri TaxID=914238 RepID=A0A1E1JY35_9HELO|nr:uncharacterized protein RAG0_01596 [Rhynchosporium agropyri]